MAAGRGARQSGAGGTRAPAEPPRGLGDAAWLPPPLRSFHATLGSTCHTLSGIFFPGPTSTTGFVDNNAVDRQGHETCLIQKMQRWVATPRCTAPSGARACLLGIRKCPFLFPIPGGSANGFLTPRDHDQLNTPHQPLSLRMANRTTMST